MTLGKRIAQLRRKKNLRQEDLANALGVSTQAVSKWENDQSCPDISLLCDLARLLGISVDALLSGAQEEQPAVTRLTEDKRKDIKDMFLRIVINAEDGDFYFDSENSCFAFKDYPNSPYYLKFSEVNKIENVKDNIAWTLKSKENSSEISEIIDFTPSRAAIWGYYYTVCCEIFKGINIKPRFKDTWTRKWKFK